MQPAIEVARVSLLYSCYVIITFITHCSPRNPTPEAVGPEDGAKVIWPPLTRDNLTYTLLSRVPEVKVNYRQKDYAFWTEYLNYIVFGTDFAARKNGKCCW